MRAFKFVNLMSAEWAVKAEVGEAPMFGSPVIYSETGCSFMACGVVYSPIAYQVGRVEAHHFHPAHSIGGIYHIDRADQNDFGIPQDSVRDFLGRTASGYSRPWILDMDCSDDCTGKMIRRVGGVVPKGMKGGRRREKDMAQEIVTSSYVDVRAIYAICVGCRELMSVGRLTLEGNALKPVCESCIQNRDTRRFSDLYHTAFMGLDDGSIVFYPLKDSTVPLDDGRMSKDYEEQYWEWLAKREGADNPLSVIKTEPSLYPYLDSPAAMETIKKILIEDFKNSIFFGPSQETMRLQ